MSRTAQNHVLRNFLLGAKDGAGGWTQAPAWDRCPVSVPNRPFELAAAPYDNRLVPWSEGEITGGVGVEGVGYIYWQIQPTKSHQLTPGISAGGEAKWRHRSRMLFLVHVPENRGEGLLEEYTDALEEIWRGWEYLRLDPRMYLHVGVEEDDAPRSLASGKDKSGAWWLGLVQVDLYRDEMRQMVGQVTVGGLS